MARRDGDAQPNLQSASMSQKTQPYACQSVEEKHSKFSAETQIAAARNFFKKIIHGREQRNFRQRIFLRISERNEYAILESSISAIRFSARV
jgi:hypothetical protein